MDTIDNKKDVYIYSPTEKVYYRNGQKYESQMLAWSRRILAGRDPEDSATCRAMMTEAQDKYPKTRWEYKAVKVSCILAK